MRSPWEQENTAIWNPCLAILKPKMLQFPANMDENHFQVCLCLSHILLPCNGQHCQYAPAYTTQNIRVQPRDGSLWGCRNILDVQMSFHVHDVQVRNWWKLVQKREWEDKGGGAALRANKGFRTTLIVCQVLLRDSEDCDKFWFKSDFLVLLKLHFPRKKERTYFV